ncbi:hypothetical protein HDU85_003454 [Gaertneriomyces sp. JEL0708]|nr:hypothetical protein HDU85_003454 [Gaertneriomyces sp. JEL0708]
MFYSQDILTSKRQSGLAVAWLAATLGSKHSFKKLSKREVNGVDVVKACDFLKHPPEPMALRLTSNLMIGVTRVYSQQTSFLYTEANQVFTRIKRAWADIQSGDLDIIMPEARYDAITVPLDEDADLPREQSLLLATDTQLDRQLGLGWVVPSTDKNAYSSTMSMASPIPQTPTSGSRASMTHGAFTYGTPSHTGTMRSITLQERPVGESRWSTTSMLGDINLDDVNMGVNLGDDSTGGAGAQSFLLADGNFDLFADIREDHGQQVLSTKRIELHDMSGLDFNIEYDADGLAVHPVDEQSVPQPSPIRSDRSVPDHHYLPTIETEPVEITSSDKTRKRKHHAHMIDRTTELSHEEMVAMRNQASTDLDFAELQERYRKRQKADKEFLKYAIRAPPLDIGRGLSSFWQKIVLGKRLGDGASRSNKKARVHGTGERATLLHAIDGLDSSYYAQQYHQTGEDDLNLDDQGGSSFDTSGNSVELFRATEQRKSEIMPWHRTPSRTSRAGSVGSSRSGRGTPLRDSTLLVDSFGYDFASREGREQDRSFSPLADLGLEDQFLNDSVPFNEEEITMSSVERDTSQFLRYCGQYRIVQVAPRT